MNLFEPKLNYMELNMLSRAMKAKLIVIMDFILTIDSSRLLLLSFSSCLSSFFLWFLSLMSGRLSFCFSTLSNLKKNMNLLKSN